VVPGLVEMLRTDDMQAQVLAAQSLGHLGLRAQAKADVFDYIERFYNPKLQHSTLGHLSSMELEMQPEFA